MVTLTPQRITEALNIERQRFIDTHPHSQQLFEQAKAHLHDGVPMNWMTRWEGDFPVFVESASGAHFLSSKIVSRSARVKLFMPTVAYTA